MPIVQRKILDLSRSTLTVEYSLPTTPWCTDMSISTRESHVIVGFEDSTIRTFTTKSPEQQRTDHLHPCVHRSGKDYPAVATVSFCNDGTIVLVSTKSPKNGLIQVFSAA